MPYMEFHDERHGSQYQVSRDVHWLRHEDYRYVWSDDFKWLRIDQTYSITMKRFPYTWQKIDAIARKFDPELRLVTSTTYGLDGELPTMSRTYKIK